ncbi:hypothetical protein EFP50_14870 [Lacticaseibacillus paracasei]|uniref:hypothetical protein n=1 Tax=Lacticaseibacillus paracasei TaxID=1597 RepID=UPI0021A68109|nr:hypothetical protein [Lacticaseibacillus paracasei]MCT3326988.1 hypothetical protein [Lacticaseibacillus paracasei]
MSNETKRDVFDEVRRVALQDETLLRTANIHVLLKQDEEWHSRYEAALPDDLPVIPELISKYLIMRKRDRGDLVQALDEGTSFLLDGTQWESVQDWFWFSDVKDRVDTFARAWVLGVWRVEETGEIVKLEAEK